MLSLVTGAAGFIGSHLAENLLGRGHDVIGVDSLSNYYSRRVKLSNISSLKGNSKFRFVRADLVKTSLPEYMKEVDFVFHLAAQPGVRTSWGTTFSRYVNDNILATQRLLEAAKEAQIKKFIFSSSSSIYGDSEQLPTPEETLPRPNSPYGATKLAAENLCQIYSKNYRVPVVILRYFTVYGPRQRPDMAFHRFIKLIQNGKRVEVFGDGKQSRDFTYVTDVVSATTLAIKASPASTFNVSSGKSYSINEIISTIEQIMKKKADLRYGELAAGDVKNTSGDISRIQESLGYQPGTNLAEGLRNQIAWQVGTQF